MLVVSSDGKELEGLCDRVLVMSRGHLIGQLVGDEVTEERMTGAIISATTHRTDTTAAGAVTRTGRPPPQAGTSLRRR